MKMTRGVFVSMGLSGLAQAAILSTGFEGYPASGAVAGTVAPAAGDVGIASDTWAGGNWSWQSTGLSYTDANGTINGGSRALDYTGSNFQFRQVNISPTAPITQTVFIRFLAKLDSAPTTNRISGAQIVINNDVTNSNNNIMPGFGVLAGGPSVTNGSNTNQFFIQDGGSFGISSSVAPTMQFGGSAGANVNLVVGRLTWDGAKYSTLDVWVNPTQSDLGSPDATRSLTTNITSLSQLVIRGGGTNGGPLNVVDEIVIAGTWNEVVIVPEPGSLALLGLGAGALARRRRA